jgi:hypothetical protein
MKSLHSLLFMVMIQACFIQAQTSWQTTHTTDWHSSGSCKLESNTIRMIINPFSIDVEEEAVISAQGTVQRGDPSTLEITGRFELTPGSAVRSMLLWNGKVLLKAKLKDKNAADSAYEKVIDRNQPVFVRHDPAVIKKVGDNTYQFRIYPVTINNSRKIRILYSVPLTAGNVGPQFDIKTAFTYGCTETPNSIPVEFTKSANLSFTFVLNHGATKKSLQMGATYLIPYIDFLGFLTDYWGNPYQSGSASISITPDSTSFNRSYSYKSDSTNSQGYYTAIFSGFPDTLSAMIRELLLTDYTLEAKVIVGNKMYISDVPYIGCFGIYLRSASAWDHNVYWTVYKNTGEPVNVFKQLIVPDTTSESCRYLPLFWATKYNLSEKTGNYGALFGFVDDKMSLLALERDSLKSAEALQWQTAGVPPLLPNEIIFNKADMPVLPPNNAIFEYSPVITAVKDATKVFTITLLENNRVAVEFGKRPEGNFSIFVVDLNGRLVYKLDKASLSGHSIILSLPSKLKGVYLMRVTVGKESYQKKFILK